MTNKGIALILVVSILTVVAITVVSFIFTMRLESRAAANYLRQVKACYVAEAGIAHAQAILKEDKANSFIDTYGDLWRTTFKGSDVDNNDDGDGDSRWIEVVYDGDVVGRYAVLVEDESAKININTAGFHNESPLKARQGATPFEVSMEDFFSAQGISSAQILSEAILNYRYGDDGAAGEKNRDDNANGVFLAYDGVDNDGDGEIDEAKEGVDEPEEFVRDYPFGDDRPFLTTEEIKRVSQISSSVYNKIKSDITAYSNTASTTRNKDLQWDINSIDAQQLLDVFLASGVASPWQKAVNLVDFADPDFAQSVVISSSLPLYTKNQGPKGDWAWVGDHYESKTYGGIKGTWMWTDIEAGEYFLILYGTESDQCIGDVSVGELTQTHIRSGESFNLFPSGTVRVADAGEGVGSLTVSIQNNESLGTTCYFKYIGLVSAEGKIQQESQEVRGSEGIRINELMIQPMIELPTASEQSPGGDWFWQGGHYENATSGGGAQGEGSWLWQDIPDGEYYLILFAVSDGQTVGDVLADGALQENMRSGELFTERETLTVSGGVFRLDIQNNLSSGSCYFKSALLSQQPDGEYVELVNLTPNEVSLDGWTLEASGTDGWPASIPLGTTIGAGDYLVLAVDKEDACSGINANGISFEDVWGKLPAAQLDFTRSVTTYSDMLDDAPLEEGEVILRDERGNIVDIQQYLPSQVKFYLALEKGDPTRVGGLSDIWFESSDLSGATPAKKNNNNEIIEIKDERIIEHNLDEVAFNNSPLANLGGLTQVTTGDAWAKIGEGDLISLADRLTVYSLRLEAEGHKSEGDWAEELRPAPQTSWFVSETTGEVGTWLWDEQDRISNGVYTLYLYGEDGEAVSVSLRLADETWTDFTPALTPGANSGTCFGRIEIGAETADSLPAHKIEMRLKNSSANGIAHFDYIRLSPLSYVAGKININTASKEVLQALPMIDETTAQSIINGRPLGNQEDKGRGIGDVLFEDTLDNNSNEEIAKFSAISNLITVRSNAYRIIATGQALHNGRVMAEKRIRAVIER